MSAFNDLRLLNIFVTVYQKNGITAAARVLNISQPSVTRGIQRLEEELGVSLFDRSRMGIVATEFAKRFYRRALSIIDEVDSMHAEASRLRESRRQLLNVGCGLGCWITVCDSLIEFRAELPETVLNVTVASARALVNLSEAGDLDVIIGNSETIQTASWLEAHDLYRTELFLVARRGHPVFESPLDTQLECIVEYPNTTYHMLEFAHGTRMSGPAALRVNDYLFLLRHTLRTDAYITVGRDMLDFVVELGLRVIGDRPIGATDYSVALPREHATVAARSFATAIQRFVPCERSS